MTTPDRIERSIVIRAPRTRVWSALTDAGAIGQWFGTGARLDLRPGGDFWLDFAGYPTSHARIVTVEPPGRFAFRWQAMGADPAAPVEDGPSTLVEFTLTDDPAGTRVTVVESGFAALAPDVADRAHADNTGGWEIELNDLAAFVTASDPAFR